MIAIEVGAGPGIATHTSTSAVEYLTTWLALERYQG